MALNELSLCSKTLHYGHNGGKTGLQGASLGHNGPPATIQNNFSKIPRKLKYFRVSVNYSIFLKLKLLFHLKCFLMSCRSCKESILLTVVQPYPVSLWMNSNTFQWAVCVFCGADIWSTLWKQVINHAICLCWHCITVALAKYRSPAISKGVQLLPSFQVFLCCSIRSSQDLRCPINIYHQSRSTRWWWTHRAMSIYSTFVCSSHNKSVEIALCLNSLQK